MRSVLGAMLGIAAVCLFAASAAAVPNVCEKEERFDEVRGTCVPIVKDTKGKRFAEAMSHLEGRAKHPNPKKGLKSLDSLCKKDKYGPACTQLAFVHQNGRYDTPRDMAKALEFYEKACKLKDTDGCIGAFEIHHQGLLGSSAMDSSKGLPYLEKACELKSGRGCRRMGQLYDWGGTNVAADKSKAEQYYAKAFKLLEKECDAKDGASCDTLGAIYRDEYDPNTYKPKYEIDKALKLFERGCKSHSGQACYDLAALYDPEAYVYNDRTKLLDKTCPPPPKYGETPPVPPQTCLQKSFDLYQKACTSYDHFDSCYKAGTWLDEGKIASTSATVNVELMAKRVCELSEYSCNLWARLKDRGVLVSMDPVGALELYAKSCNAGNGEGCRTASERYYNNYDYKTAVAFREKACELYDGQSCTFAAAWYYWGDSYSGIERDLPKAQDLYVKGCYRSDPDGCLQAGAHILDNTDGPGVPTPASQAVELYSYGCYGGSGRTCYLLGEIYEDGRATGTKDPASALGYYEQACFGEQNWDYTGCTKTIELRKDGPNKDLLQAGRAQTVLCKNYGAITDCQQADAFFKEAKADYYYKNELMYAMDGACNQAYPAENVCIALALMYRDGSYSINKDPAAALPLLQGVCDRGYTPEGCFHLAVSFEKGLGVAPDKENARLLYTRACDGYYRDGCVAAARLAGDPKQEVEVYTRLCYEEQHPQACNGAATAYYIARGVDWDLAEAYRLFDRACELEDSSACMQMGTIWQYGIGQEPDQKRAYDAYQKACDKGNPVSCGRAAWYIERGEGGATKDPDKAEQLLVQACDKGEAPDACRWLSELLDAKPNKDASKVAKVEQRAMNLAKAQAEGNPYVTWLLGTFHRDGVATVVSAEKAADLFVKACDANLALGCLDAGRMYMGVPGFEAKTDVAVVHLEKACAANVGEACKLAEQAKAPQTPGVVGKPKTGCCDAGSSPGGGVALALGVLGLIVGRRRRRARR